MHDVKMECCDGLKMCGPWVLSSDEAISAKAKDDGRVTRTGSEIAMVCRGSAHIVGGQLIWNIMNIWNCLI